MRVKTRGFEVLTKLEEDLKLYDIELVDDGEYEVLYIHSPLLLEVEDIKEAFRKEIPIVYTFDTDYDYAGQKWYVDVAEVLIYKSTEEMLALQKEFGVGMVISDNDFQAQKLSALFKLIGAGIHSAE